MHTQRAERERETEREREREREREIKTIVYKKGRDIYRMRKRE